MKRDVQIAEYYKSVVATDVSEPQLSRAIQRSNIAYVQMSATPSAEELERVVGPEGSVDLVTVATAVHWFDLDKFYTIVNHLLRKPGGVFAVWTYHGRTVRVSPQFDIEFYRFQDKVNAYRTYTSEFTSQQYKNLPFPFEPVPGVQEGTAVEGNPEELTMEKLMSFDDFLLLMKSGSPLQTALDQGVDLLNDDARETLSKAWGPERVRNVVFPVFLLLGTVSSASAK